MFAPLESNDDSLPLASLSLPVVKRQCTVLGLMTQCGQQMMKKRWEYWTSWTAAVTAQGHSFIGDGDRGWSVTGSHNMQ